MPTINTPRVRYLLDAAQAPLWSAVFAVAAAKVAFRLDPPWSLLVAAVGVYAAARLVRGSRAAAVGWRRFPGGLRRSPVDPQTWAAFLCVVADARMFTGEQRESYQRWSTAVRGDAVDAAFERAHQIGAATGRVHDGGDGQPAWVYLDELSGIVAGAVDVAQAVLVRDLLHPADFDLLTRWWVAAGLPLPSGPVIRAAI